MKRLLLFSVVLFSSLAAARTLTEYVDGSTQRQGMHACAAGSYMVGAHLGRNWFSCARFGNSTYKVSEERLDASTQQQGMHACPAGMAMTGLHVSRNLLLCAPFREGGTRRFTDAGTQRNGMHACPWDMPMTGIHAGNNVFLCQY